MKILLFSILFLAGVIISMTTLFSMIHEEGHVGGYDASGVYSKIVSPTRTMSEKYTMPGLHGGYLAEFSTALIVSLIVFLICRKQYWMIGLSWGYCHGVIYSPARGFDFYAVPEWTAIMWQNWLITTIPLILIGWALIIIYKWLPIWENLEDRKNRFSGQDKHPYADRY